MKYVTLMGHQYIPFIASTLGAMIHWGLLMLYAEKGTIDIETVALATTFG